MNITLTGADARTLTNDLFRLSDLGAEIGALYTASPDGRHRYPQQTLIWAWARVLKERMAIHICGTRARAQLHAGELDWTIEQVGRVQVNGVLSAEELLCICRRCPRKTIITQHNEANAGLVDVPVKNHALLVDGSGGRGISPERWERPETAKRVGFAGGLNADNLTVELPKIAAVAQGEWWIDMEGGLRDADDWFSVEKAMAVMEAFNAWRADRRQSDRDPPVTGATWRGLDNPGGQ